MKRWIYIALAALIGVIVYGLISFTSSGAQKRITVVIDAGHGGFDGGAIGRYTKVREDVINLAISKELKAELEKAGVDVVMTREDESAIGSTKDGDMYNRRKIIEAAEVDAVISIHQNICDDGKVAGPIVFYMDNSASGAQLAKSIQATMNDELQPRSPKRPKEDTFFILRSGKIPCVIVECGFLSNAWEEEMLQSVKYQKRIARAISWGVLDYFNLPDNAPEISLPPNWTKNSE